MKKTPKNLLILYTGGTIGMQTSATGLIPASGFDARLREAFAQRPDFSEVKWHFRELSPPIDSANMTQHQWLTMREAIVSAVDGDGCDAILLLHGTDTLAYSAAALSFLLRGLPIPLVLTGAMHPADADNSDAWPNVFGALAALQTPLNAGVWVFFHGELMAGTRASKRGSARLDAFHDHQRPATAADLEALLPDYRQPRQPVALAVLPFFPGMTTDYAEAILNSGAHAVILECYGNGTGPADNPSFINALRAARQRGVLLLAISQCPQGAVAFGQYAADSALAACGVLSGAGLSREAALGLLFALLGAGWRYTDTGQRKAENTDQPIRSLNFSSAANPTKELPAAFNAGDQTHKEKCPGTTAMMPPPTPLFPGNPTR